MEIKIKEIKTANATHLHVSAGVRYWEDASVNGVEDTEGNLIPCRNGEYWEPIIELAIGKITNWTLGLTADIHYKVCDDGNYKLVAEDGTVLLEKDGYVPDIMCPHGEGYGDYIIMKVHEDGLIADWKQTLKGFEVEDED